MNFKPLLLAAALAAALPAHAALTNNVGDIGNPIMVDFEAFDGLITEGPNVVAPGITFTGTQDSILGANLAELGVNGTWGLGNHFAATGEIGTLHFTFNDGLVSKAAGAFLNSYNGGPMIIAAYGDNSQVIESYIIRVNTDVDSYNDGKFFGIARANADIRSIAFTGVGLVADDLTVTTPVPEPESYAMLLAGLGMVGFIARRRNRK